MKYFKVYMDFIDTIGALGDAERGRLFTAMLDYARTGTEPELGGNERYIWGAVKSALDKQRSAYENVCSINKRIATERNGASRTVTERNGASQEESIISSIDPITASCNEVIDFLNQVAGTQYKHSETSRKHIRARLNDGFTVDDCKRVICKQWKAWRGTEWQKYMRPETLFNPTKFEGYLNAGEAQQPGRYDNLKRLYEETTDD